MQTPSRFGYAYDLSGNMTNDGANALTYDAENELVTSGGTSGTYTYDGNGNRRVARTRPVVFDFGFAVDFGSRVPYTSGLRVGLGFSFPNSRVFPLDLL